MLQLRNDFQIDLRYHLSFVTLVKFMSLFSGGGGSEHSAALGEGSSDDFKCSHRRMVYSTALGHSSIKINDKTPIL